MRESILPLQSASGKRYMPGLDGLRALSVFAVIAYHLNLKWAQGGLLGVGIFFVISGYLITDQIINYWEQHRRFNLLDFWIRRARRLLPAMIGMLLFVALWLLVVDPSRLHTLQGDFISSLFYVNNWWLIFHKVSYFESFGPPSPIGHLWSLAIEEQFYILWPLLLLIGLKFAPRRGKLIGLILVSAAASALAMALIYVPGTDPSRVYYGTDTRVFALLIGAALAVLWPSQKLQTTVSGTERLALDLFGGLGLFVLIILIYQTNEFADSLYRGGFVLLSFIAAVVIAVLAHPASRLGWIMGCKPLRWIGVRSYSLYIWHYPVIILTSPNGITDGVHVLRIIIQLVASFLLAALSYKYVEEPIRRGSFKAMRQTKITTRRRGFRPVFLIAVIPLILIPIACSSFLSFKPESEPVFESTGPQNVKDEHKEISNQAGTAEPSVKPNIKEEKEPEEPSTLPVVHDTTEATDKKPADTNIQSGKGVTAIGDSVILDAAPFLDKMLPGIVIDGKVGRQMSHAPEIINRLKEQGKLGNRIIIELGTNGAFNKKQLRKVLHSLRDAEQILLINTRVPRKWQDTVNADIAKVSSEFSNTTIVDWYSASKGKDDYFYKDGVHLKREGAEYYASILVKAMEQVKP
ncbi:acetyltransferase [Paenibacillus anaericanus]|uniref:Acetyltransferase n=2 Tax=Paenibacillus anaericanus TaxID=170367 RepID=A0A3S1DIJ3_9BACL|nr:acyltransferase family protein [Paenibacillus anaericanus]RUT45599.1 acetyltransferase [Paenibacillus anaericanus]